ncbi:MULTISPECIES: ClpXP protease specificity-enhancing factor SspB [unclassified Anaerobiospirillum]|uniref:ClpXP protease specificity-enhancing factor SspB n=1 Tax=unclassified Anaerobiospirillum TaxID=2647410 RepID=UPI001FF6363C|nr:MULTISPECIES: ClpXP protease specificity-enhancing factor SspB [unclassified Anaerobiospirillum]MCK0525636.1 ClpXP protease specificity-enhancing factor SspB [Anaerobiospirillum sp. NML120449]MCK0533722.1 ClpXP protease specificity-enhancing factor SspB [Anaerobiospirillum sp. NML120511]MCK0540036.1 ClpXP protease specificity-enhancing factor SspB [Anaerobiospirillum sp. NML02-A-032]
MISTYSYMFTAFYNWLRDNNVNPRMIVDATRPGVTVPQRYVVNGVIVISIAPNRITDLEIWQNRISFNSTFDGRKEFVVIPYNAMSEVVITDAGMSIPMYMWLNTIELACHEDELVPPSEDDEPEAEVAKPSRSSASRESEPRRPVTFIIPEEDDADNLRPTNGPKRPFTRDSCTNQKPQLTFLE